jgi:hypothetical protein
VLSEVSVERPEFAETPTKFLESVARLSPRGRWPRSFAGQQLYWAVVGEDGVPAKALLSEDGALEIARGGPSIEPFLLSADGLRTWADASSTQSLDDGGLPLPTVVRSYSGGLTLEITAFAADSTLFARYRVRNAASAAQRVRLVLAVRPVQVNPPQQFLNLPGGFSPIHRIRAEKGGIVVDGRRIDVAPAFAFGATSLAAGDLVDRLARGALPAASEGEDPEGFASGAAEVEIAFQPGEFRDATITAPLWSGEAPPPERAGETDFDASLARERREWQEKLGRVRLELPAGAPPVDDALRSSLAWILVERDGPAIQPGARDYARSWIRDGAMMSEALLRLGHSAEVGEYLRWYSSRLLPGGRVPCCVDRRGADPVPENDSGGELLHLAAEYFRFTRDRRTLAEVWPQLAKAAASLDELRGERRTEEYRAGQKRIFFGLLPESISHEGYSSHPVHSYWDDFWALLGYSDAAWLAAELGRTEDARKLAASRDELRGDLHESIRQVIASRGIDYVPGSAELADLDATSTTIALDPGGELSRLPRCEVERTFERYWSEFEKRRAGASTENAYTPYEWRVVGSLVRLGWRDRAGELFDSLFSDRRPQGWNQWPEVVSRDPRAPRFVGDMPHGWVACDFIRSTLDLFAWDRKEDGAVVLAAGVPSAWLAEGGARLEGLRMPGGTLTISVRREGDAVRLQFESTGPLPPGGYVLRPPLPPKIRRVRVDGRTTGAPDRELVLRQPRATVLYEP